jgi:hypothetical protein
MHYAEELNMRGNTHHLHSGRLVAHDGFRAAYKAAGIINLQVPLSSVACPLPCTISDSS